MPLYDRRCNLCGYRRDDLYEQSTSPDLPCPVSYSDSQESCCGTLKRIPVTSNPGAGTHAHGDECDVWMKHGLCSPDGSPKRYTSKQQIARDAKKWGWTNAVEHRGSKDSDKSKHTQRWI